MYSVEGVKMLLPQGSFARFYYLFRQLQRILPLMHLAVRECKLKWLSSDNLRLYRGDGISIVLTGEISIHVPIFPVRLPTASGVSP